MGEGLWRLVLRLMCGVGQGLSVQRGTERLGGLWARDWSCGAVQGLPPAAEPVPSALPAGALPLLPVPEAVTGTTGSSLAEAMGEDGAGMAVAGTSPDLLPTCSLVRRAVLPRRSPFLLLWRTRRSPKTFSSSLLAAPPAASCCCPR